MAAASDDPPPPSAFADDVAPTTTSSPPGERAGGRWSSSTSSVAFDPDMSGREGVGVGGRRRWVWRWILIMLHSRGAAGSPHLRNKSHDVYQKREIKNLQPRQKVGRALFCCMLCSTCQDASEDSHRPHQQQGHPTLSVILPTNQPTRNTKVVEHLLLLGYNNSSLKTYIVAIFPSHI